MTAENSTLRTPLRAEIVCFGGTDETTSGTTRLQGLGSRRENCVIPLIPVNEASTKHIFDNKYGTGQSSVDGLIRATGLLVAGKTLSSQVMVGSGKVSR